jgi:hypothetical protein
VFLTFASKLSVVRLTTAESASSSSSLLSDAVSAGFDSYRAEMGWDWVKRGRREESQYSSCDVCRRKGKQNILGREE